MVDSPNPVNRLAGTLGYKDKTLLVTGSTGFMGKLFIEKVLRTCPEVSKIYVLVRDKKGKSPQERIRVLFESPLFDLLKSIHGTDIFKKVISISGDIAELGMGLSEVDRKLLTNQVQIIFHMAATIRFDEPLKKAVILNTRGTKLMLELAKECRKLLAFTHVSTAYCHLDQRVLYEKAYPPPADPHIIINAVEWLDEKTVDAIADKILGKCPNTYAFTKALAESLVNDEMDNLPVLIIRPSVVVPVWLEPIPGWTDNINGPSGLLIAAGKGILRTMYCNSQCYADFLPVDIAVNIIMLATFDYMTYKKRRYFNGVTSFEIKLTWTDVIDIGRRVITDKMPFNGVVWYPGGSMKSSRFLHRLCVILFHYVPATILDAIIFLSGNEPALWKIQRRITKGFDVFEYYANNQWDFNNDNCLEGRKFFNEIEKKIYVVDAEHVNFESYMYNCIHSIRLYMLNEKDDTLPAARRHMKVMWCVDKFTKIALTCWLIYFMYKYFIISV